MQQYRVKSESKAPPSAVYALLVNGSTWPRWMGVSSVEVEKAHGELVLATGEVTGDVRLIRTGRYANREQIVELIPNQRFAYVILDGMLLDYKGVVELTKTAPGGTLIQWSANYRMSFPGAAWLMKLYLRRFMQKAVSRLASLAEESLT